ncbi:HAD family hydrolase [Oceanithermus desulfurans]
MARALIALDLDGTLLKHGVFLPDAPRFLERLRAAGHLLAVNTGRLPAGFALEAARRIRPDGLHAFSDGALIADARGRIRSRTTLDRSVVRRLLAAARDHDLAAEFHTALGVRYHLATRPPEDRHEHVAATGTPSFAIDPEAVPGLPLVGAWLLRVPAGRLDRLRAELGTGARVEAYGPREGYWILGVKPAAGHKGTGLLELARGYGVAPEATVMLGDGLNDLGGLEAAGLGIAVGNAPDFVQRAADRVVAPADEGGLLEAAELILQTFGRAHARP